MKHITKIYDNGIVANNDVTINLNKGELLAIVGENGAGKTTIMEILFGLEKPTSGDIYMNGERVNFHNPTDAMKHGIGMLHQHFMLFNTMTVAENIMYNNELRKKFVFYDKKKSIEDVRTLSKKYNLALNPNALISDCPVGVQQRVEILKILYRDPDIIIFDEPSAVLTPLEVKDLLNTLRKLVENGKSIILITHKLHEVMAVADRIVVMRKGRVVGELLRKDTSIEELSYLMIGRQLLSPEIPPAKRKGKLFEVEGLNFISQGGKKLLNDINIHVGFGEIVGISGVSGNGQSELVRCMFGFEKPNSGSIRINGKEIAGIDISEIRKSGISLIPEDRYLMGSSRAASLTENVLIGNDSNKEFCKNGIINWKRVRAFTNELINKFKVDSNSPQQKIGELSGGNAQKLIVAREMTKKDSPLLTAYEPTRGIDIGAIEFIHSKLLEKRNNGEGVLLISTELSEIMLLCDRIYVIYNGSINGEFQRGCVDDIELGLLMVGGKSK